MASVPGAVVVTAATGAGERPVMQPDVPVEHSLDVRKVLGTRLQLSLGVAGLLGARPMPG
jgi:hypothetical protein